MSSDGDAILNALKGLTDNDFREFCYKLTDPVGEDEEPCIPLSEVDGKDRATVRNALVTRLGPEALDVTVKTLEAIRCRSVALRLKKKKPADVMSGAAGGTEPGAAAGEKQHFVDRHRENLIDRVSNTGPLLDYLLKEKVLLQEQYSEALEIRPKQAQMRFLFNNPLRSGGENSKKVLLAALEKVEPLLVKDLRENQG